MSRILALDFETSGLDLKRHAPVSIGVALFEHGEVLDTFERMIGPPRNKEGKITREYDVNALEISGAKWPAIKSAPSPAEVCGQLTQWVRERGVSDLAVIAFNAPFDFGWYSELLGLAGGWNQIERRFEAFIPPLVGPWQCARLMATARISLPKWSLNDVAAYFALSRSSDLHGALEDAILAGRVYHRLLELDAKAGAA